MNHADLNSQLDFLPLPAPPEQTNRKHKLALCDAPTRRAMGGNAQRPLFISKRLASASFRQICEA